MVSVASVASSIVLADYTEENRDAVQRWLSGDSTAFNWDPYLKYIVETLEELPSDEVEKRKAVIRSAVKAIVSCDITQEQPIEEGYEGPYNIVITSLCLDTVCQSESEYKQAISKIAKLVKLGGHLLLYSTESESSGQLIPYTIGSEVFYDLSLSRSFVQSTLEKVGFHITSVHKCQANLEDYSFVQTVGLVGTMFFIAQKKHK